MRMNNGWPMGEPLPLLAAVWLIVLNGAAAAEQAAAQSAFEACRAAHCLAVEVSPDVLEQMGAGAGVEIDGLLSGLRVRYRGEEPLAVRVIAMRYQDGRLVRYRVSNRLEVSPAEEGAAAPEGAQEALRGAFRPVTEKDMFITTLLEGEVGFSRIAMERMVGNLPPTYLISEEEGRGLLDAAATDDTIAAAANEGALGVIALLPEQAELRAADEARSHAVLVSLNPTRR